MHGFLDNGAVYLLRSFLPYFANRLADHEHAQMSFYTLESVVGEYSVSIVIVFM